eukprot:m.137433 g.137433  ORF g.137433 m.137433 type:complete len:603 (-) comp9568_c1_seq1:189-1997(-)
MATTSVARLAGNCNDDILLLLRIREGRCCCPAGGRDVGILVEGAAQRDHQLVRTLLLQHLLQVRMLGNLGNQLRAVLNDVSIRAVGLERVQDGPDALDLLVVVHQRECAVLFNDKTGKGQTSLLDKFGIRFVADEALDDHADAAQIKHEIHVLVSRAERPKRGAGGLHERAALAVQLHRTRNVVDALLFRHDLSVVLADTQAPERAAARLGNGGILDALAQGRKDVLHAAKHADAGGALVVDAEAPEQAARLLLQVRAAGVRVHGRKDSLDALLGVHRMGVGDARHEGAQDLARRGLRKGILGVRRHARHDGGVERLGHGNGFVAEEWHGGLHAHDLAADAVDIALEERDELGQRLWDFLRRGRFLAACLGNRSLLRTLDQLGMAELEARAHKRQLDKIEGTRALLEVAPQHGADDLAELLAVRLVDLLQHLLQLLGGVLDLEQGSLALCGIKEAAGRGVEDDAAQRPDIGALVVRPLQHLGRHPVHRADCGAGAGACVVHHSSHAEVPDGDVKVLCHEDIGRLEVSVDDLFAVHKSERFNHLPEPLLENLLGQRLLLGALLLEDVLEIACLVVVHDDAHIHGLLQLVPVHEELLVAADVGV